MNCIDEIVYLFETRGHAEYLGEPVSQKEHALQSANLAFRDGAPDALVAAALLHDIGHLLPDESVAARGADHFHEEIAAHWLRPYFGREITEPIRLHVLAKRYLCTIERSYYAQLSQASIDSLEVQGGLLSHEEVEDFEQHPHFDFAVRVRRWDEAAKTAGLAVAELAEYIPLLRRVQRPVTDF